MSRGKLHGFACAAIAVVLMGTLAAPAWGWNRFWIHEGTGLWDNPSYWDSSSWMEGGTLRSYWGVPGYGDTAHIDNEGTATLVDGDNFGLSFLLVGDDGGNGSVVQSGGTLDIIDDLNLAPVTSASSGTYILNGGLLQTGETRSEHIGYSGSGTLIQTGGRNGSDAFYLGNDAGASGTYLLSASGTVGGGWMYVGYDGTGVFNQSGGTNTEGIVELGWDAGSYGTYTLSDGLLQTLLRTDAGTGIITQTGGTQTGGILLGAGLGGTGVYNLSGGSVVGHIQVGDEGGGTFNQSGGTAVTGGVSIGGGGSCTYNLSAGSLTSTYDEIVGGNVSGGTFNQTGGTNAVTGSLSLQSKGTYNLSTSPLSMNSLDINGNGAIFNQTSGATTGESLSLGQGACNLSSGSFGMSTVEFVGTSDYTLGKGTFNQSGGTNTTPQLQIGYYEYGRGTYNLSGGILNVSGTINVGQADESGGRGILECTGGTATAGRVEVTRGSIHVGKDALVTAGQIWLYVYNNDSPAAIRVDVSSTGTGCIHGTGGSDSTVEIGPGDYDLQLLDLQTGAYRPNQGDTFHVLAGYGSISGTFSAITTNLANSDANINVMGLLIRDPNATDPNLKFWPAFHGEVEANDGAYDYVAVFQGAMAGDATCDNKVDSGDFGAIARNWMQSGKIWTDGDFNGDGTVDSTDFGSVARHWGSTGLAPGAAPPEEPIPEPATLTLLAALAVSLPKRGGLALLCGRRRFGG